MFARRHDEHVEYYMISETMADPYEAEKCFRIVNEEAVNIGGLTLFTLNFDILMSEFMRRNWNGRNYDKDVFMKALDGNPLIQHDMHGNPYGKSTWQGEYGHPDLKGYNTKQAMARQMTIDPKLASHVINKYWADGNKLYGNWTTVAGGYGEIFRNRILTGIPAMASTRSVGGVDSRGNVMPGLVVITVDSVIRPSSQDGYMVKGSDKIKPFNINMGGSTNVMSEAATTIDIHDDGVKDFLLTESVSKDKINMLCDALDIDADTMVLSEGAIHYQKIDGNTKSTIIMPLNKVLETEMHNIF